MIIDKGWNEYNYKVLKELINNNKSDEQVDKYKRNYVVADWDNTSAMFDVEDAIFLYQIMNLEFKMSTKEFKNVLVKDVEEDYIDYVEKLANIISIKYDFLMKLKNELSVEEIKSCEEYKDFIAMMTYLYGNYAMKFSYKIQCYKILYLFKGFTEEELRNLAKKAIEYWHNEKMQEIKFSCNYEGILLESVYKTGLRNVKEVINLYESLRENNIDVYVCTASSKIIVEEFATNKKYGYNFNKEEIEGLIIKKDESGKFIDEIDKSKIQTFLEGKAEFVRTLENLYNKAPILTMGDSSGDYNLLTYKGIKNGLIFNRKTSGNINILKEKAMEKNSIYLLQNRDELKGELSK